MDTNVIYCGDCLAKLKDLPDESIDLIYIDPPFSSNRNYVAFWQEQEARHFEDRFENVQAYCDYMYPRVKALCRVLKQTGSFYYHCDYHASHYIKVMLDRDDLFGYQNFRNEIIWKRTSAKGLAFTRLASNHDVILRYTKSDKFTWNPQYSQHDPDYIDKFYRYAEPNTGRRYRLDNLANPNKNRPNLTYEFLGITRVWRWTKERMEQAYESGLIVQSKPGRVPALKRYLDEQEGTPIDDIWLDIPPVQAQARERLGYPTQKPLPLLQRIIAMSTNEGDIVLDAFCGCGTTLIVAQREKRRWIGIDISPTACRVMATRFNDECGISEGIDFVIRDLPKTATELREYPPFEFQNWAVNALGGVSSKTKVRDKGIDGKVYPIEHIKREKGKGQDLFGDIDRYIPVQVKRTDQVGRPDIENFETAMKRDRRNKGIFVGFDFSRDAEAEIRRAERDEGLEIEPITVAQIIEQELDKQLK
jgi:DNA modification methylase